MPDLILRACANHNGTVSITTKMAFQPKQVTRATSWSDQVEEGTLLFT